MNTTEFLARVHEMQREQLGRGDVSQFILTLFSTGEILVMVSHGKRYETVVARPEGHEFARYNADKLKRIEEFMNDLNG